MFDQSGRLSSADPKVSEAFLKATGGQTLPSSPAAQRAWELSQQRAMQMQQGMAEGRQAVASLKEQQAANPATISGLPSSRVVTSDTGAKAVLDAQGNIVGTNIPVSPAPLGAKAINQGQGTSVEQAVLGPNIRDAFLREYAKKAPLTAAQEAAAYNEQNIAMEKAAEEARQGGASTDTLRKRIAELQAQKEPSGAPPNNPPTVPQQASQLLETESLFGSAGIQSPFQAEAAKQRAQLYKDKQDLESQLTTGQTSLGGNTDSWVSSGGPFAPKTISLDTEHKSNVAKQLQKVREKIKSLGATPSEMPQPTIEDMSKWLKLKGYTDAEIAKWFEAPKK